MTISNKERKVSENNQLKLLIEFFMVQSFNLMKNIIMNHKELVDQVSAHIFKESGKIESRKSWLAMRNYLEQLDDLQLKAILKEK